MHQSTVDVRPIHEGLPLQSCFGSDLRVEGRFGGGQGGQKIIEHHRLRVHSCFCAPFESFDILGQLCRLWNNADCISQPSKCLAQGRGDSCAKQPSHHWPLSCRFEMKTRTPGRRNTVQHLQVEHTHTPGPACHMSSCSCGCVPM